MTEHTPGPWRRGRPGMGSTVFSAPGKTIGKIYHEQPFGDKRKGNSPKDIPIDEGMANLNLIIAAPDLLAACKDALEDGKHYRLSETIKCGLRAAIAKAQGKEE